MVPQGGEGGAPLAQGQDARKQRNADEISKVTDQRMYARSQMNSRSQETVSQTIAAVESLKQRALEPASARTISSC